MKKKHQKAFTLAEVLISLTIIGVIAAITVPALIQRTNKQEYVTALQKAYSTLSQATNMIMAENGSPRCDKGGWACSAQHIYELYKQRLNNSKDCGTKEGCFASGKYKAIHKKYNIDDYYSSAIPKLVLSDGMHLGFGAPSENCNIGLTVCGSSNGCSFIYTDINGSKGPNIVGRDLFWFVLKDTGIFPCGCDKEDYRQNCQNTTGTPCACKVLTENAMNY